MRYVKNDTTFGKYYIGEQICTRLVAFFNNSALKKRVESIFYQTYLNSYALKLILNHPFIYWPPIDVLMSKFVTALFYLEFAESGTFEVFQILYY